MRVTYDEVVAATVDALWRSLTDVDGVLAALPGVGLTRVGDAVSGSLKCRLGSAQITYRITVTAVTGATEAHTATLTIDGKEARGPGTLAMTAIVTVMPSSPGSVTDTDARLQVEAAVEAAGRGATADEAAWSRLLTTLVNAVPLPVAEPESAGPVGPVGPGEPTQPAEIGSAVVADMQAPGSAKSMPESVPESVAEVDTEPSGRPALSIAPQPTPTRSAPAVPRWAMVTALVAIVILINRWRQTRK